VLRAAIENDRDAEALQMTRSTIVDTLPARGDDMTGDEETGDTAVTRGWPLPAGVTARRISGVNGMSMHILESGRAEKGEQRPLVLLLHGFPELSYSWRRVLPALGAAGWHAVAPDQRGYGLTTGWRGAFDDDLEPYTVTALVDDAVALTEALGHRSAAGLVGHDFGAVVGAWAALLRPDVFRTMVLMSAPFGGPPAAAPAGGARPSEGDAPTIHEALAALPRPRKHYQWYYATREADADMHRAPQGVHDFLRAYYHMKSADWVENDPRPLPRWDAESLARMPTYYIMDRDVGMAATVAPHMPARAEIAANRWLTDSELAIYADSFERTGFQAALNWYRCKVDPARIADLVRHAGRTIDVPSMFIAGKRDWGIHQVPGALEKMHHEACTRMEAVHLLEGAGHWVQQEQSDAVNALLLDFLARHADGGR
jgi:pimeloyl-ACP methyl ester carboxylesterase